MEKKLTDEELKQLTEEEFFEYLDKRTQFLKRHTKPLSPYHVKKYHTVTKELDSPNTEIDYQRMKEIITEQK
jgi:hypothetical protein